MKELRKKTYLTIFAMLSLILTAVTVFVNVQNYKREKEDVLRSLDIVDNRTIFINDKPGFVPFNMPGDEPFEFPDQPEMNPEYMPDGFRDLENMIVMDHELYTAKVENGTVTDIISHGNSTDGFDAEAVARKIAAEVNEETVYVGNLYFEKYSYRYRYPFSIVIMNNADVSSRLLELLFKSAALFVGLEMIIAFISRLLTGWITRPALDAFERQKEFIADASHELKTPLAVIMASADEMASERTDDKNLENIRYESDRMSRLIAGLLNLSRLESGSDMKNYRTEDLSLILEKTCLSYEGVAFEQGVSIESDIEEGISCKCNKEEIEQMVSTVLDNAVRHSYKDTAVRVSAVRKSKSAVQIRIINKGDPIPDEDREKIFERFYRGDRSRNRNDNRYGLGLAIARRIARNHGGDITASSDNGETVFQIVLK